MDVLERAGLAFPKSLPDFQQLFSDDAARHHKSGHTEGWTLRRAIAFRFDRRF